MTALPQGLCICCALYLMSLPIPSWLSPPLPPLHPLLCWFSPELCQLHSWGYKLRWFLPRCRAWSPLESLWEKWLSTGKGTRERTSTAQYVWRKRVILLCTLISQFLGDDSSWYIVPQENGNVPGEKKNAFSKNKSTSMFYVAGISLNNIYKHYLLYDHNPPTRPAAF